MTPQFLPGLHEIVVLNLPEDATGYGPIFEEEPVDVVYTEDSPDKRISMNCRARANPPATYRSQMKILLQSSCVLHKISHLHKMVLSFCQVAEGTLGNQADGAAR